MQQYEVLSDLNVEDAASPVAGTHAAGSIIEVALEDVEQVAQYVADGFLKLVETKEPAEQNAAPAQVAAPAAAPAATPTTASPETLNRIAPSTPITPTSTAAADATAALQAKFPAPPAPYDGVADPSMKIEPMLYAFCQAIEAHEVCVAPGVDPRYPQGTRAYFDKNPGNLKYRGQAGTVAEDKDGFAVFSSVELGFVALANQVRLAISGKSVAYKNPYWNPTVKATVNMNFLDFFKVYDSSAGDDPVAYANDVAASMSKVAGVDVSVETVINQLV